MAISQLPGALQEVSFAIGKPVSAVKAASDLLALERKRGTKEGIARALLLVTLAVLDFKNPKYCGSTLW